MLFESLPYLRSSVFWNAMQRRLVFSFTNVLGQLFSPNFKYQAVQAQPLFHADDAVLL